MVQTTLFIKLGGQFDVVGFDATHIERGLLLEICHQGDHGFLEGCAGGLRPLGDFAGGLHPFRPHLLEHVMATAE